MKVHLLKKVRCRVKIKQRNGVFYLYSKRYGLKEADNKVIALAWYYYDVVREAREVFGVRLKNNVK